MRCCWTIPKNNNNITSQRRLRSQCKKECLLYGSNAASYTTASLHYTTPGLGLARFVRTELPVSALQTRIWVVYGEIKTTGWSCQKFVNKHTKNFNDSQTLRCVVFNMRNISSVGRHMCEWCGALWSEMEDICNKVAIIINKSMVVRRKESIHGVGTNMVVKENIFVFMIWKCRLLGNQYWTEQ